MCGIFAYCSYLQEKVSFLSALTGAYCGSIAIGGSAGSFGHSLD